MKSRLYKKYVLYFFSFSLCILLGVSIVNLFMDPFDVFRTPDIDGINSIKPEYETHTRMTKAYAIKEIRPLSICLGSSRAEVGINPNHPGWGYQPVFNLGLSGANIYEITRYFQHANEIQPLKQVILTLDFFSFNVYRDSQIDFENDRLSVDYDGSGNFPIYLKDKIVQLASLDALRGSLETFIKQNPENTTYLKNGMMNPKLNLIDGPNHDSFLSTADRFLRSIYLAEPNQKYDFVDPSTNESTFTYFQKMLSTAYENDIDMYLVLSPCHVYQWEILAAAGLWEQFEDWKRILVEINEAEATNAGKTPFALWDFSTYCDYTTEAIPPIGDVENTMQWYWDCSHYKQELGDIMLDQILKHDLFEVSPNRDFGALITGNNIEPHLLKIRDDRQQYRNTHPSEIAEIEQLAAEIYSSSS